MTKEQEIEYLWNKGLEEMIILDDIKRHLLKKGSVIKHKSKRLYAIDRGFGVSIKKTNAETSWQCTMCNLERFLYDVKSLPSDWKMIKG